jgi:hypothetical protein
LAAADYCSCGPNCCSHLGNCSLIDMSVER